MREALAIADEVTVLRHGRAVLSGRPREVGEPVVIGAMIGGGAMDDAQPSLGSPAAGASVMSLEHVSATGDRGVRRLQDVSMEVRAGEIVGIAGIEGSGQHELLRVLAGRLTPCAGVVRFPARVGFVPEDRLRDALIPEMTLVENLALKEAGEARGSLRWASYQARAVTTIREHDVRTSGVDSPASALSGGNQQKFVLGRELEGLPRALVVENPTRGLDIRASARVLAALRSARASGVAVALYSSDLDEVLSMADRMFVCFDGRVTATAVEADAVARALVGLS
ncbi:MAG: ATP-binding cassette domain-containing protein [Gemmatimonadales bacterium]